MSPSEAVREAIEILGSQASLAKALEVKPPTIAQWAKDGRPVPPARAVQIEAATSGKVKKEDLCPVFPWPKSA